MQTPVGPHLWLIWWPLPVLIVNNFLDIKYPALYSTKQIFTQLSKLPCGLALSFYHSLYLILSKDMVMTSEEVTHVNPSMSTSKWIVFKDIIMPSKAVASHWRSCIHHPFHFHFWWNSVQGCLHDLWRSHIYWSSCFHFWRLLWLVFKSPVGNWVHWQLDWTTTNCNWIAVASCKKL